jgi:uncharacterized cupin superfamily protein
MGVQLGEAFHQGQNTRMVPEAPLQKTGEGLAPKGEGWFVVNARDARWLEGAFGAYTRFEGVGDAKFPQLGINIGVLQPGQASCMYHAEDQDQEGFLVLQGEALLLVEGEERPLKAWDFFHCPAGTEHVIVGAGDGPCAVLAVGPRTGGGVRYPESEFAQRHGAGVERETTQGEEAYASFPEDADVEYRDDWLPG